MAKYTTLYMLAGGRISFDPKDSDVAEHIDNRYPMRERKRIESEPGGVDKIRFSIIGGPYQTDKSADAALAKFRAEYNL